MRHDGFSTVYCTVFPVKCSQATYCFFTPSIWEETELMQEIVANGSASGPEVAELKEAENDEAAAEEPTLSTAEMRSILHHLQIGLERRGFEQMQTFETFDGNVRILLRQTPL